MTVENATGQAGNTQPVGWVGLGGMGLPMAANLHRAGREVLAWNRGPAARTAAAELGISNADLAQVAGCPVVFSALSDDAAVRSVLASAEFLETVRPGSVHINCSTISAGLADEMQELYADAGAEYLSAPVFGRTDIASAGRLTMMVAGRQQAVEEVLGDLETVTQRIFRLGERAGEANLVKILGNYLIAGTIGALGEITAVAEGAGLDRGAVIEILTESLFGGLIHRNYGAMIGQRQYEPVAFTMTLGLKDVDLARAEASLVGAALPLGEVLSSLLADEIALGNGDRDWAALADRFRRPEASGHQQ